MIVKAVTKDCPKRQLAIEEAEKHMSVNNELMSLQKEIEAGTLVRPVHIHWMWNKFSSAKMLDRVDTARGEEVDD